MVAFLKNLLNANKNNVAEELNRSTPETRIQVATCAILLEIANSDDEFSDIERRKIIEILRDRFSLSDNDADELIEIAQERIDKSIDIWGFTNTIVRIYKESEKKDVLEAVWEVVYADGRLSGHEDTLVHKLSFLMGLNHDQLIDTKLKVINKIRSGK